MRFFLIFILFLTPVAQAQTVQWVIGAGGTTSNTAGSNDDIITCVKTDSLGNVYMCGQYWSGSSQINGTPVVNNGVQDAFIAKLDCNANVLWVRHAGGIDVDITAPSLELDADGHVYLAGGLSAQPTNSWMLFDTLVGTSGFIFSWYLAKFDTSGNLLWTQMAHNTPHLGSEAFEVEVDHNNRPVVSIYAIDPQIMQGCTVASPGRYLVTLDTAGNFYRVMQPNAGHSNLVNKHFKLDAQNNVYITGYWEGDSIDINGNILYSSHPGSVFQKNFLLYVCDSTGNTKWYHQFTDTISIQNQSIGYGIILDQQNNSYIVGRTTKNITSNNFIFNSPAGWSRDIQFVAKFNFNGVQQWIQTFPFNFTGRPNTSDITFRPSGNLVTAHSYQGKSLVGTDTIYTSAGSLNDVVITELSPIGSIINHEELYGTGEEQVYTLACSNADAVYLAGAFNGQISYNSLVLAKMGGNTDGFLARFGGSCTTSVNEISNEINLLVYPNPVENHITLTWDRAFTPVSCIIYNSLGQKVQGVSIDDRNGSAELSTSMLPQGFYLLQLTDKKGAAANTTFVK